MAFRDWRDPYEAARQRLTELGRGEAPEQKAYSSALSTGRSRLPALRDFLRRREVSRGRYWGGSKEEEGKAAIGAYGAATWEQPGLDERQRELRQQDLRNAGASATDPFTASLYGQGADLYGMHERQTEWRKRQEEEATGAMTKARELGTLQGDTPDLPGGALGLKAQIEELIRQERYGEVIGTLSGYLYTQTPGGVLTEFARQVIPRVKALQQRKREGEYREGRTAAGLPMEEGINFA